MIETIKQLYSVFEQYPSIQTDTRKLKKGDLFFALKGENFNGNLFAIEAIEKGAAYAIVDEVPIPHEQLIIVTNVLETLQELAKYHRQQFTHLPNGNGIPFIAITGSNGKTTTKELVSKVLSAQYITYTTQGNLNNHIGIPLTLLSIQKDAAFAVIEMGANHQKEIESYCTYTLPTHGIITNCGKAHLEGFGGEEGVKKGKGELFDFLKQTDGTAFIFNDEDYLQVMSKGIKRIFSYGTRHADICGEIVQSEPFLQIKLTKGLNSISTIATQLVGNYNLPNILCAIAVGKYFNVPEEKIKLAIESYIPSNSRSQLIIKGDNHFILDAYNANPSSMKLAIENFAAIKAPKKILLLGAMMELGKDSVKEHQQLIALIQQYQWENVILVGGDYKNILHNYLFFNTVTDAAKWFHQQHFTTTYFLIKGSRSMQMEKILEE